MDFPQDQIEELRQFCPGVCLCTEGGEDFIYLPSLKMPLGCKPETADGLLCPRLRDGYNSRLFFSTEIQSRVALNWNAKNVKITDKNWFAFSWRTNRTDMRLLQMVVNHLSALK